MTDTPPGQTASTAPSGAPEATQSSLRSLVILSYVLFLLALVNGFTAVAGVVIAHVKLGDTRGTVWHSHFRNMIVVFWTSIALGVLAVFSFVFLFGFAFADFLSPSTWLTFSLLTPVLAGVLIVFPVFAIWYLYRIVKGVIRASEERAY
jgi:uncharacterized membrane protein